VTVIMISLVDNQPKTLSLKAMLQHFIDFRVQVIERRTQFFLAKAQARDHIVQGLLLAMDNLDQLVDIIRKAADNQAAAAALAAAYGLTPTQTDAVLSISLRRLTSVEVKKLKAEHLELEATINDLVGYSSPLALACSSHCLQSTLPPRGMSTRLFLRQERTETGCNRVMCGPHTLKHISVLSAVVGSREKLSLLSLKIRRLCTSAH